MTSHQNHNDEAIASGRTEISSRDPYRPIHTALRLFTTGYALGGVLIPVILLSKLDIIALPQLHALQVIVALGSLLSLGLLLPGFILLLNAPQPNEKRSARLCLASILIALGAMVCNRFFDGPTILPLIPGLAKTFTISCLVRFFSSLAINLNSPQLMSAVTHVRKIWLLLLGLLFGVVVFFPPPALLLAGIVPCFAVAMYYWFRMLSVGRQAIETRGELQFVGDPQSPDTSNPPFELAEFLNCLPAQSECITVDADTNQALHAARWPASAFDSLDDFLRFTHRYACVLQPYIFNPARVDFELWFFPDPESDQQADDSWSHGEQVNGDVNEWMSRFYPAVSIDWLNTDSPGTMLAFTNGRYPEMTGRDSDGYFTVFVADAT